MAVRSRSRSSRLSRMLIASSSPAWPPPSSAASSLAREPRDGGACGPPVRPLSVSRDGRVYACQMSSTPHVATAGSFDPAAFEVFRFVDRALGADGTVTLRYALDDAFEFEER